MAGRSWAYVGMLLSILGSTAGNVADTVYTESGVVLWLRIVFAAFPPIGLWVSSEIVTRAKMRATTRWLGMGSVAVIAAVVSYGHLYALAVLTGQGWISYIWPLMFDGLMILSVAVLYSTGRTDSVRTTLADRVRTARSSYDDVRTALVRTDEPVRTDDLEEAVRTDDLEVPVRTNDLEKRTARLVWDRTKAEHLIRTTPDTDLDIARAVISPADADRLDACRVAVHRLRAKIGISTIS